MSKRARIATGVTTVVLVGTLGILVGLQPFPSSATRLTFVDETTLVTLRGQVELQRAGASFTPVIESTTVRVGDRIRTGPDSHAALMFFDGSSSELEPNAEIIMRRLDRLSDGGQAIAFHQEAGATWNRAVALRSPTSRFETTTASSIASAQGTEYRTEIQADGSTLVESVTDTMNVEATGVAVTLPPGFRTTIASHQPPSAPVRSPAPRVAMRIDITGPALFFVTDDRNRSAGFHPDANAYVAQIPGAKLTIIDANTQRLVIPNPIAVYDLVIKGQEPGGTYTLTVVSLVNGQEQTSERGGLASPPFVTQTSTIEANQLLATTFRHVDGQVQGLPLLRPASGAPSRSHVALARNQQNTAAQTLAAAIAEATRGTARSAPAAIVVRTPTTGPVNLGASAAASTPRTPMASPTTTPR